MDRRSAGSSSGSTSRSSGRPRRSTSWSPRGRRCGAVAASGGGTVTVGMPGDPGADGTDQPAAMRLVAPGVEVIVDLAAGGRIGSFMVDGHELLRTTGESVFHLGVLPDGAVGGPDRDGAFTFDGRRYDLPVNFPPHAIHGTTLVRPLAGRRRGTDRDGSRSRLAVRGARDPGLHAVGRRADLPPRGARRRGHAGIDRLASLVRAPVPRDSPASSSSSSRPGRCTSGTRPGIATAELVTPPPGPWDDCFTDVRRPPLLRWPGFLELTIESECPDWVVYTEPVDALCVEPQTAPPDALNGEPAIVGPGRPLVAEMTWRWRRLAG